MLHFQPVPDAELLVDVLEVCLDGVLADEETRRDLAAGKAIGGYTRNMKFPLGQIEGAPQVFPFCKTYRRLSLKNIAFSGPIRQRNHPFG